MKQNMKTIWVFIAMLCASISASAYDFEVDGIYYKILSLEDLTCEVTYNSASASSQNLLFNEKRTSTIGSLDRSYPSYKGDVSIPSMVNYKGREFTVTGIGEFAFLNCRELHSLTLPSTILNIEEVLIVERYWGETYTYYAGAFDYCQIETLSVGNAYILEMFSHSYAVEDGYMVEDNLKSLLLTSDFSGTIDVDLSKYKHLSLITSNTVTPPSFGQGTYFSNNQFIGTVVKVPSDAIYSYKNNNIWSSFWRIDSLEGESIPPTTDPVSSFWIDDIRYNVPLHSENKCSVWSVQHGGRIIIPEKVFYAGRELDVIEVYNLTGEDISYLSIPSSIESFYARIISENGIEINNSIVFPRLPKTLPNLTILNDFCGDIDYDFTQFSNLEMIKVYSEIPPVCSSKSIFSVTQYTDLPVFVPEDALADYQSADVWKEFWELKPMKSVKLITLSETSLNLEPNQTVQLIANALPEDAFDTSFTWNSSDPNVASVDAEGVVTAITKGDAIITVSANGGSDISAECAVHVDLLVKEIELSETEIGLEPGDTKKLNVTVNPAEAFVKDVVWSSDNEEIASVDQDGNVIAKNIGIATITVQTTDGSDLSVECKVKVAELVKAISVLPTEATIKEGETMQFSCSVAPESATYKEINWTSDDNDVATVDSDGLVTAVSSGTTKIKANATDGSDVYGECTVTVTAETINLNGICYQRNSQSSLKIVANTENPYSGDLVIPSSVIYDGNEMQVTEIGAGAFSNCQELTRLVIPNTIVKVKEPSFEGCKNLEYIKICDGSILETNLDNLFPDSPIKELYIGSDNISYVAKSRILSNLKGMILGNSVATFPPKAVFSSLEYFVVEDGDEPIVEPDDYCTSSKSLVNQQTINDSYSHIMYRTYYLVKYTHLSPILDAIQNSTLNYLHIGRDVVKTEVDTSKTQELIPTTAGSRYQEYGYEDEIHYQYQEGIVKSDYNRTPVEAISINKSIVGLHVGEVVKLSVEYTPDNVPYLPVEWLSSDEQVAIVDIFGNVTKISEGEAVITVRTIDDSNLSATCKIVNFDDIIEDGIINVADNGLYEVYNLLGVKLLETNNIHEIKQLSSGLYIINGKMVAI